MKTSEATKIQETNPLQNFAAVLREKFSGKNGLIAAAVLVIGGGMILNWGWLVAAGLAPLILGILPCAAMCALGLCANKMMGGKSSCSSSEAPPKTAGTTDPSATEGTRQIVAERGGTGAGGLESAPGESAKS